MEARAPIPHGAACGAGTPRSHSGLWPSPVAWRCLCGAVTAPTGP